MQHASTALQRLSPTIPRRLNTPEAAEYLGVSISYLNKNRMFPGAIRYAKIGARVVYDIADLDAFLANAKRGVI